MELKLLEDFLCVHETRNFSRAAKLRNVSQSALSKRIRMLEDWIGATLIDRSSYPVTLTPEGRALIPQARELVHLFHGMRDGIRSFAAPSKTSVRLGSLHTLRLTILPKWRELVQPLVGPVQFDLHGNHQAYANTLRQFQNGESELLLTYCHPAISDGLSEDLFDSILVAHERVIPVSIRNDKGLPMHRLDTGAMVSYLSYGSSSFFGRVLAWMLAERPLPLNVAATNAMSVGLMSLAEVGCGVAWVPERLMADKLASGALVPAGGPDWTISCDIRLYRPRTRLRPIAEQVWSASQTTLPLADLV